MTRRVKVIPKLMTSASRPAAAARRARRSPRAFLRPMLFAGVFVYLGFHAMNGERGLYAWLRDTRLQDNVEQELANVRSERESLELKVSHLRDDSIDLDLLDEQVRRMLGGVTQHEVIVLVK
jgi:cell division protein FtsB